MKKCIVLGIVFLFVMMSFTSISGIHINNNKVITFDRDDILYVGGNGTGNYTKIQDAIDDASDGDTVFVYDDSSPYTELIIVDKSIILIGENKNTTVIDGEFQYENCEIIRVVVENVKITNLKFIRAGYGIVVYGTSNVEIFNNTANNTEYGIAVCNSSKCLVKNNFYRYRLSLQRIPTNP